MLGNSIRLICTHTSNDLNLLLGVVLFLDIELAFCGAPAVAACSGVDYPTTLGTETLMGELIVGGAA